MAKIFEGQATDYSVLLARREKLVLEIAHVSKDLAQARGAVLSEVDAFSRARVLSLRLSELAEERDALSGQIERVRAQPEQAQQ